MTNEAIAIEKSLNLETPHEVVGACEFGYARHIDIENGVGVDRDCVVVGGSYVGVVIGEGGSKI